MVGVRVDGERGRGMESGVIQVVRDYIYSPPHLNSNITALVAPRMTSVCVSYVKELASSLNV